MSTSFQLTKMPSSSDGGLFKKFSSKGNRHLSERTNTAYTSDIVMSHPSFRSTPRHVQPLDGLLHPRSSSQHPLKWDTRLSSRYDHSSGFEELSLSDEWSGQTSLATPASSSSHFLSHSRTSNHSGSSGFHDDDLFPSQAATGAIIWCEVDTHGQEAGAVTVRVRCKEPFIFLIIRPPLLAFKLYITIKFTFLLTIKFML